MTYTIRPASTPDIPHLVAHREGMFRDMGVDCDYPAMAAAYRRWLDDALPSGVYRGWVAETTDGEVVAGGGVIVMPWSPGPTVLDPRMAYVFNVYTDPAHRRRGLARRLMEEMHAWCRAEGIARVSLNASEAGLSIYESMGYEVYPEPMMRVNLT
jgi:GNAT superfamily N-acetyltransferase